MWCLMKYCFVLMCLVLLLNLHSSISGSRLRKPHIIQQCSQQYNFSACFRKRNKFRLRRRESNARLFSAAPRCSTVVDLKYKSSVWLAIGSRRHIPSNSYQETRHIQNCPSNISFVGHSVFRDNIEILAVISGLEFTAIYSKYPISVW